jgi:hypothetical protein
VLSNVELKGDSITIKNVRDFRYNNDETICEVLYLKQRYQLSEFKHTWFGLLHFGKNGLAYVSMSFELSGDKYLVVSIEARLKDIHVDGYSPIKGLFREHTKTIVLATEQDVIGQEVIYAKNHLTYISLRCPKYIPNRYYLIFLEKPRCLTENLPFIIHLLVTV